MMVGVGKLGHRSRSISVVREEVCRAGETYF